MQEECLQDSLHPMKLNLYTWIEKKSKLLRNLINLPLY